MPTAYIKNMVCQGTDNLVVMELKILGLKYSKFESGRIEFEEELSSSELMALDYSLNKYGLEIIFFKSKIVNKIQNTVLDLIMNNIKPDSGFSYYISRCLGYNYTYLNRYFKEETGIPIEEYYLEKINLKMKLNESAWAELINPENRSGSRTNYVI